MIKGTLDRNGLLHFGRQKPEKQKETVLQQAAFSFIKTKYRDDHRIFHPPNGGLRPFAVNKKGSRYSVVASKMKAEGVQGGVADICIDIPARGFPFARIELKRAGGRLNADQINYLLQCKDAGAFVCVCWNLAAVIDVLQWYLASYTKAKIYKTKKK